MGHKKEIFRLRSLGHTYSMIQKELGCSRGTISYHLGPNQKQKTNIRSQKRRSEIRAIIGKIKEESGCIDCKIKYPYFILEFDHVRGVKFDNIGFMVTSSTIEEILEEIKKCDIVCSNCHRVRTQNRKKSASIT